MFSSLKKRTNTIIGILSYRSRCMMNVKGTVWVTQSGLTKPLCIKPFKNVFYIAWKKKALILFFPNQEHSKFESICVYVCIQGDFAHIKIMSQLWEALAGFLPGCPAGLLLSVSAHSSISWLPNTHLGIPILALNPSNCTTSFIFCKVLHSIHLQPPIYTALLFLPPLIKK